MIKVVFLDRATMGPGVEIKRPTVAHQWTEYERTGADQVLERARGAQVIITNKSPVRADTIDQLPELKMISVAATGYDVIDTEACRARGIQVSNVRGYAVNTVPEHTFALILGLRRSMKAYVDDVIAGQWQRAEQFCFFNHPIKDLAGCRLGIIGAGAIGQSVARLATAFGMEPVFAARKHAREFGSLYTHWDEVIESADILSLHGPLTPDTRHCIAAPEFARMKKAPLIINTARGGLVDEQALVDALQAGNISGIGFDVLSTEPPTSDNPLLSVLDRPDVLVTPHVAWASEEARKEVWRQTIEHVDAFAQGRRINAITP